MSRVLVVSEDTTVAERLEKTDRNHTFEVAQTDWRSWELESLTESTADIFLLDYRQPAGSIFDSTLNDPATSTLSGLAKILRQRRKMVPVVIVTDLAPPFLDMITAATGERQIAFAPSEALTDARSLEKTVQTLAFLYDLGKASPTFQATLNDQEAKGHVAEKPGQEVTRAFPHLAPNLRNPKTGRLDARLISNLFAIPLKRLVVAVGGDSTAAYKTPDAESLQKGLHIYERIAVALLGLIGSEEGLRLWLNAPEPDLDNEIPRNLLLNGEGDVVADLLEDMCEGQSA